MEEDDSPAEKVDEEPTISEDKEPTVSEDEEPTVSEDEEPTVSEDEEPTVSEDEEPTLSTDLEVDPSLSTEVSEPTLFAEEETLEDEGPIPFRLKEESIHLLSEKVHLPSSEKVSTSESSSKAKSSSSSKEKKEKSNRCQSCRKKLGLTGFTCRCGGLYCAIHRYSDKHDCNFDYRKLGADEIRKNNPIIEGEKIHKI